MRRFVASLAIAAALAGSLLMSSGAHAAPAFAPAALGSAASDLAGLEAVQYYHGGRQHCWYDDGWHGPGWYWCGYRWRRGFGWGGPAGWHGWVFGRPHRPHHPHRW